MNGMCPVLVLNMLNLSDQVAGLRGLTTTSMGRVGSDRLVLLEPKRPNPGTPNLLIAAGFHGEEPAGCLGLLEFLQYASNSMFKWANLSFLPIVNPTGLRLGQRNNYWNENPNCGFTPDELVQPSPSREGRILLNNLDRLLYRGRDGFLTLHEDVDAKSAYLFTFEDTAEPTDFTTGLRDTLEQSFPIIEDVNSENLPTDHGVVYRMKDGSFEDLMFSNRIPKTACTETPGTYPIKLRTSVNFQLIQTFINHFIR